MRDEPRKATEFHINALRERERRRLLILAGDAQPTLDDRIQGLPPVSDNPIRDMRRLAQVQIDRQRHSAKVTSAFQRLVDAPSAAAAVRLAGMLDQHRFSDVVYALNWLAALLGHRESAGEVIRITIARMGHTTAIRNVSRLAFALGLASLDVDSSDGDADYEPGAVARMVDYGLETLRELASAIELYDSADNQISDADAKADETADTSAEAAAVAEMLAAVEEDRAELGQDIDVGTAWVDAEAAAAVEAAKFALVVVPKFAEIKVGKTSDRLKIREEFRHVSGQPLRLVKRGDVGAHRATLVDRWPHLADQIDVILRDLAVSETVRFRPTILVGNPGTGKTALARAIAAAMDLPCSVYGGGGFADGTFAGLAAHWSSSGPSMPLHFIGKCQVANPLIVVDEIDKAARSTHNGSLQDALLQFLEPTNAQAFRDPSIELTVDLSRVNYIMTANDLGPISRPLRDRCRIIRIPDPGAEHLAQLVPHIVADIAKDRGVDPRWHPALAGDELDVVRSTWVSGSIRKLRRVVELMLDGRDAHPAGRA